MQSLPPEARSGWRADAARWGHRGLFAEQVAGLTESLRKQLAAKARRTSKRIGTARRLVAARRGGRCDIGHPRPGDAAAPPEVQYGLIDALSQSPATRRPAR